MNVNRYQRLAEKNEGERLLDGQDDAIARPRTKRSSSTLTILSLAANMLLVCTLGALLSKELPPRNKDLKKVSLYSPILDQVELPVFEVEHDNTLWAHSKYGHAPSDEIDALWSQYDHPRFLLVTEEDVRKAGKDPELTVQHPEHPGSHIAMLAVDHQIHCLNSIRKNLFPEYYYPNGSSSPLHEDHLLHCIDLIHQTLTCNANVDLITANWLDVSSGATLDFKINMKCRNYDALKEWQWSEESTFFSPEEANFGDWRKPEGAKTKVADRNWYELMVEQGYVTPEEFEAQWGEPPFSTKSQS